MRKGMTMIELLVVVVVIAAVVLFAPWFLGRSLRRHPGWMVESVNARNLQVGMATYAISNKDYFPGLTSDGDYISKPFEGKSYGAMPNAASADEEESGEGCTVSNGNNLAMAISLEEGFTTPAQWISPGETNETSTSSAKIIAQVLPDTSGTKVDLFGGKHSAIPGQVRDEHSSFAMLAYGRENLKEEWKANQNQNAVILGTRVIFHAKPGAFNTVWTDTESGKFKGSVVRGDCSTSTEVFDAADCSTFVGKLNYGKITPTNSAFTPSAKPTTSVIGIFGRSTDMKNFDATATTGQLGSAND